MATAALASLAYAVISVGTSNQDSVDEGQVPRIAKGELRKLLDGGTLVMRGVDGRAPRADGNLRQLNPDGSADRVGDLSCKRVAISAGGRGLCFRVAADGNTYEVIVFDSRYRQLRRFPVEGIPDRARLSPSGRYGAYTSFDPAGAQAYFETPSGFSTYTRIFDTRTGKTVIRLEDVKVVLHDPAKPLDINDGELWGVTFLDDDVYYATLALNGHHYLIKGHVGFARALVITDRVECPSLSPDGTKIAYKRRVGDTNKWRLHVFDLVDNTRVALAEERSIDDQPEWIGNGAIAYSDDRSIFVVPANGKGRPALIGSGVTSPDYANP